jgi:pimeloyl-ACP methyl ester carboxylesterase
MSLPPISAVMTGFFSYEQLKRSFYIFLFQTPLAEIALNEDFIAGLWRDWSPGHQEDIGHVLSALGTPENISAAIGYYRAMFDASRHLPIYAAEEAATTAVGTVPTLYLHGSDDGCLGAELVDDSLISYLPPGSRAEIIQEAGHFLQVERPEQVNAAILSWL